MASFDFSLKNRVAIVTGAGRGIGKAIALAFADAGADLVVSDLNVSNLESVASEIQSKGRRSLVVKADVSHKQDVDNMVAETLKVFGTVDILINNAARVSFIPLMRLREDGWDKIMDIDVKGCYLCAQAVGRVMIDNNKGNIINIGSVAGSLVNPYEGVYAAAKAAVAQLSRVLASELAHHGIRVNCIAPGVIRTKMAEAIYSNPKALKRFENIIPIGRIGEPDEIASVAVFLASEAASYLTGAVIYVDGGASLSGVSPKEFGQTMPEKYQLL
jgi:NAD(P)-dependent dehydrogenase (short-subunit alcohol dehydrogenase family)